MKMTRIGFSFIGTAVVTATLVVVAVVVVERSPSISSATTKLFTAHGKAVSRLVVGN